MHYSTFFSLLFLMIASPTIKAQKIGVNRLEWRIAGALPTVDDRAALGVAGPIAGVHNEVLLVGGGANFPDGMPWAGGKKAYHNEINAYQKRGDSLLHVKTTKLTFKLAYATSCTTPEGVVVAGGENENGLRDDVFLLQWNSEKNDINISSLPSLPFALTNGSAVFFDHRIYLAGGERGTDVSNGFFYLDLNNTAAGWKGLPPLPKPLSNAVMVVQSNEENDCIYLIGGRKRNLNDTSTLYASVLQFDFKTKQWTEKKPLPYPLSAGTGAVYGSQYILLFGGDAGETFHKTEALIAAINKTQDETKKKTLNEEKAAVQSSHPGFCRQVFLYNTAKDRWQKLDCIPYPVPVTTTAVKWGADLFIPSGEIKAGVRSPYILSAKINR